MTVGDRLGSLVLPRDSTATSPALTPARMRFGLGQASADIDSLSAAPRSPKVSRRVSYRLA
jgi:hypothetical protein